MKFTLEIEIGNEAMQTWRDVANALELVAEVVVDGDPDFGAEVWGMAPSAITDLNGNKVGAWAVSA